MLHSNPPASGTTLQIGQQPPTSQKTPRRGPRRKRPVGALKLFEFVKQFTRRRNRVGVDVRPANYSLGVDDENRPAGIPSLIVEHVISARHFAVRPEIARHREWDPVVAGVLTHTLHPGTLDGDGVTADLDDLGVRCLVLRVVCAEPAHLVQSPAREAGRVKPYNHVLPAQVGKRDAARVAVQREIRGRGARLKCHMG